MLIQIKNPINGREIYFGSKQEFSYYFGDKNYQTCSNSTIATVNHGYIIRSSPTGFFGDLVNNPNIQKGANQDGSDFTSDFKSERILTWTFNNISGINPNDGSTTWDWFNSIFNIKNRLLEMTVFWFNPVTQEIIENQALVYKTSENSWEAGQCQVVMDGNGLFRREPKTYTLLPYNGTIKPYLYFKSGTTPGETYTGDLRKAQFGLNAAIGLDIVIPNITGRTPIKVSVTASTFTDFEITNLTTGIFSRVDGTYANSTLVIDSNTRTVSLNGDNSAINDFSGGFIFLTEGTNTLRLTNLDSSNDVEVEVEVNEYADSISG